MANLLITGGLLGPALVTGGLLAGAPVPPPASGPPLVVHGFLAPMLLTRGIGATATSATPFLFADFDGVTLTDDSDPFGVDPDQTTGVN